MIIGRMRKHLAQQDWFEVTVDVMTASVKRLLSSQGQRSIVSFEDSVVIQKILAHLDDNATSAATGLLPDYRASPTKGLFD
jgi:hypothetical protein